MQFEAALGALPCRIGECLKQSAALRAAGNGARPGHLQGARAEGVVFPRRLFCRLLTRGFIATVLVAALSVFSICHRYFPPVLNCRGYIVVIMRAGCMCRTRDI